MTRAAPRHSRTRRSTSSKSLGSYSNGHDTAGAPPSSSQRPRALATLSRDVGGDLRLFHRWRDRRTVWGSSSLVGLPNGLQLFNELVCVGLGFPPCCKGIERCVSHLHVLGNAPSVAATLPGVLCDIDYEDIGAFSSGAVAEGAALGVIVTRIVAHCVARSAHDLLQAVEQSGTCLGHAVIGSLAARHPRPAAFFDIRRLLPRVG